MIIADDWDLRWYKPEDLKQLVDLHRECFPNEDWSAKDFDRFVNNKSMRNNVVKVLVADKKVYGSLLYTVAKDAIMIRRVAVRADVRRQGLAAFMLNSLCGPRSPLKRKLYHGRVRENNLPAIKLLKEKMGFAFDPKKSRDRDKKLKVDYYEFTLVKAAVPKVVTTE